MTPDEGANQLDEVARMSYSWHKSEIETAISSRSASFDLWFVVFYYSQPSFNPNLKEQTKYLEVLTDIFEAFKNVNGELIKVYFCDNFKGAVALTKLEGETQLHVLFNILETMQDDEESTKLAAMLYECRTLHLNITDLLRGKDRTTYLESIYWVVTEVFARLDKRVATTENCDAHSVGGEDGELDGKSGSSRSREEENTKSTAALVKDWEDQLAKAKAFYERTAKRLADICYCRGMLAGLLCMAAIGSLIGWRLSTLHITGLHLNLLAGSFTGGAVGAFISVAVRMTHDNLELSYETSQNYLTLLGMFRPVFGTVFGLLSYFILASQMLHVVAPGGDTANFYFYIAVAFASGFSERFAQDMLKRAETSVATS